MGPLCTWALCQNAPNLPTGAASSPMLATLKRLRYWLVAWIVLSLVAGTLLARNELVHQREAFDTDARIVHRLLSQRAVQHDAILATLALLRPNASGDHPEQRLPALYSQILSVSSRSPGVQWHTRSLSDAEEVSRRTQKPALAAFDPAMGRYQMVLAGQPESYALTIDIHNMVPWTEWPSNANSSPVRISLYLAGQERVLQKGLRGPSAGKGWNFEARKVLATESQPFEVVSQLHLGWAALPWSQMLASTLLLALALLAAKALLQQREERRRSTERQRLGQIARLNTLGELAAGMAHELNQPLTAMLANTQAASRMLDDTEPDFPLARQAMQLAVQQARRASEVVTRLRRTVERPSTGGNVVAISLADAAQRALYVLEPDLQRHKTQADVHAQGRPFEIQAEPVALEQIIHNLVQNALQAMEQTAPENRRLCLILECTPTHGVLRVQDSGPGIFAEALPRIFEPFFTTREGGLGLGLSLCETLAIGMGAKLTAANLAAGGAEFILSVPLATPEPLP